MCYSTMVVIFILQNTGKVLHSVSFILSPIFLPLVREKSGKDLRILPFVVVLNITLCSLDAKISAVRTTAKDNGQEHRYTLQCVQLQLFAALLRTIDRNNAKLG